MHGELAAPFQMHATGGVKQTGELGEPVAAVAWRDRSELFAEVLRQ